mmetsp:Transcript_36555/g.114541  ORF Transcript_36555/g.114541 Transcript_36555/m.114541 type:complete len:229 (+) Transcript_36555:434-1120(+)
MVQAPMGLISSRPTPWMTTPWSMLPTAMSDSAMSGTSSSWKTPMTTRCARAALVMGPRMLKTVRTPSALRAGATSFMAGWFTGAYMKPTPHFSTHSATFSGSSSILMPSASSTSAEPHMDDTERLPALQVLQPAAAASTAAAVEMLMVCAPSPPVPTMSRSLPVAGTVRQALYIPATMPEISSGVSPLRRSSARSAPTCVASAPPRMTSQASSACAAERALPWMSSSI